MARALDLAARGLFTSPNPRVGCVLVRDDEIVGEGFHHGAGSAHAEAVALESCPDPDGTTAYVTLEPCAHNGRTPPCARALVAAGVVRVVVSIQDPDPRVSGRGLTALRGAGIDVTEGVLEDEARALNRAYLHQRTTGRPLLRLKLALSLDGRLAAPDGSARWITSPAARRLVHERRAAADAIVVGAGTVVADDPALTVRDVVADRQPTAVVLDASGVVRGTERLFHQGRAVVMMTTDLAPHDVHTAWKEAGAEVVVLPSDPRGMVDLDVFADDVARRKWLEVLCEGGARLATGLLRADLVDLLELHSGAVVLGAGGPEIGDLGIDGIGEAPRWTLASVDRLGDDVVSIYERAEGSHV